MFVRRALPALLCVITLIQAANAESRVRSKFDDALNCEAGITGTKAAIAVHRYRNDSRRFMATALDRITAEDRGHIAVLENDGTILTEINRFDLTNSSITFTPSSAGYSVAPGIEPFDDGSGSSMTLNLADDDTYEVALPFAFVFFGIPYTSVFLNSDGNLTFTAPDTAWTERNLKRIASGVPRIAPFFADLNPLAPGRVTVEPRSDRVLFTWTEVGEWSESGSVGRNTFQAILHSNGAIRFAYRALDARTSVVAIAPGAGVNLPVTLLDLSTQQMTANALIGEVFADRQELDLAEIGHAFYRTHPDEYDGLVVFSDFDLDLVDAFAYALPVRNSVQGILTGSNPVYDFGNDFGSSRRLSVVINMGGLVTSLGTPRYPADPYQRFLGSNHSLSILGHEFGHRWLAHVDTSQPLLLGRDNSHWSFLHHTSGSLMEGNGIQDLGGGRFRTTSASERYSPLDQYVMGLRRASEVPQWFVVQNPVLGTSLPFGFSCSVSSLASCAPFSGVEFSGTRRDVALDEITSRIGPRIPDYDQSQKDFRVAFILITQRGQAPRAASLQTLEALRTEWPRFFRQAVEGRGTVNADLLSTSISELSTRLAADGSRRIETSGIQDFTQVGYATLESAAGISVLRSLSGSNVRSEAALPAAAIGNSFTVYVERGDRTSTGLAIVNTTAVDAAVALTLSAGSGQTVFTIPARNQKTQFIHELLPDMPAMFTGTATLQSNVALGVVALRGIVNEAGEFIMTTVPVSTGSRPTGTVIFPQIADGGGYVTEVLLANPTSLTLSGSIEFSFEVTTDRGRNTRFTYEISPGEAWKLRTAGVNSPEQSGFAALIPSVGDAPVSTLVLAQYSGAKLKFAAGVPGARALSNGVMPGVSDAFSQSAIALVNQSGVHSEVTLTAFHADGSPAASEVFTVAAGEHRAAFLDQLMPMLAEPFEGAVTIDASIPLHIISLRALVNSDGEFLMTSMPVLDRDEPPPVLSYFPQLVDGGHFTTEFLMLNPNTSAARLQFFDTNGQPLSITLQ